MQQTLIGLLGEDFPWAQRIHCFDTVDSTNLLAKRMALQGATHGTVLIASRQEAGRGRLGRSFHSPEGQGIYLSLLLRPACPAEQLMHLTCAAAVAMCDALETVCESRPGIKWTNDIVFGKRKLGGILTELGWSGDGQLDYAVVGIGINRTQQPHDFPEELRHIAGSASMLAGHTVEAPVLAAAMIRALWNMDRQLFTQKPALMQRYRTDCITIGQDISLVRAEDVRHGKALNVDENGGLLVAFADGSTEIVTAGEVSVRGMYGYV